MVLNKRILITNTFWLFIYLVNKIQFIRLSNKMQIMDG